MGVGLRVAWRPRWATSSHSQRRPAGWAMDVVHRPLDRDCHPHKISATWRRPVLVALSVGAGAAAPVSGGGPRRDLQSPRHWGGPAKVHEEGGGCLGDDPARSCSCRARGRPYPHGPLGHALCRLGGCSRASAVRWCIKAQVQHSALPHLPPHLTTCIVTLSTPTPCYRAALSLLPAHISPAPPSPLSFKMAFVSGFTGMPVKARASQAVCRTRMALEGGKSSGGGTLV